MRANCPGANSKPSGRVTRTEHSPFASHWRTPSTVWREYLANVWLDSMLNAAPPGSTLQIFKLVWLAIPVVCIRQWFPGPADGLVHRAQFSIDRNELHLVSGHVFFCKDRVCRALGDTDSTVDALVWIDDQKIRTFLEAVNRANVHTIGEFALDAVLCNNVGHGDV